MCDYWSHKNPKTMFINICCYNSLLLSFHQMLILPAGICSYLAIRELVRFDVGWQKWKNFCCSYPTPRAGTHHASSPLLQCNTNVLTAITVLQMIQNVAAQHIFDAPFYLNTLIQIYNPSILLYALCQRAVLGGPYTTQQKSPSKLPNSAQLAVSLPNSKNC